MNKKTIFLVVFLALPALCAAQTIKYVTYFPTPQAFYTQLNVTTLGLLATRGVNHEATIPPQLQNYASGNIVVGSPGNAGLKFDVPGTFETQNLELYTSAPDGTNNNFTGNVTVGNWTGAAALPMPVGSFGAMGNISVAQGSDLSNLVNITADNYLRVSAITWPGSGGIGLGQGTGSGAATCNFNESNAATALRWRMLKLNGTDEYRIYLTCP